MADIWEYKIVVLSEPTAENSLNLLGHDGWELIGFRNERWVLKRKKITTEKKK